MAGKTVRKNTHTKAQTKRASEYQYGNTVRKFQVMPDKRDRSLEIEKPLLSNRVRRNRDKALRLSGGYVMFLAFAVVVTVGVCISYLQLKADMTQRVKNISSLESEVSNLKSENDETYNRISNSVDLEYVKKVALEELGMVYATEEQVVLYENEEGDYVRQYEDVPEAKGNSKK